MNQISNIDILEKVNFKELKALNLAANNISDIKALGKVKFEKLEVLIIGLNKIDKNKYNFIIDFLKSKFKFVSKINIFFI